MEPSDREHARANSSGDQSKRGINLILDSDWVEYALYYILPKILCLEMYGGGVIQEMVVAIAG